ncbi:MAG: bifunctional riboflavin kinase/FAD synthetase [Halofilum sp. (in: g-proteobacteria)]|nr:bifunctional riboflavin kinase/FAD synthetase [Halofilum sp. (in: g-proteobacteria)]
MELIRGRHNLGSHHRGCALTIGNFDGTHLGHQAVIGQLRTRAEELGVPGCVVTFEPHPREFFDPSGAPARLSRLRDKVEALAALGVDRVLVLRFDGALAALEPDAFIDELLVDGLGTRHVVVGDDFRFGRARAGDYHHLVHVGERAGFGVEAAATRSLDGERVSSTRVREALARGDLDGAARLLGGPYTIRGRVIHGEKLGRDLGYPTANIALDRYRLPLTGVFAVVAWDASGRRLPGVANLGWRPTVGGTRPLLEVHVFDFDGDLYGAHLCVELRALLRPEERFDSVTEMTERMHEDARRARAVITTDAGGA